MQAFSQHYIQPYCIERQDEAPEVGVQLPTWQETQHTTGQPMDEEKRLVGKLVDSLVDMLVDRYVDTLVDKYVDSLVDKYVDRLVDSLVDRLVERYVNRLVDG